MNKEEILQTALKQSAIDCSCAASDFLKAENVVVESLCAQGARRYLKLPHVCDLVTYGSNTVACCQRELIPEVRRFLYGMPSGSACFETPAIYRLNRILEPFDAKVCFMAAYFLPETDKVFGEELPSAYETRLLQAEDLKALYLPEWSNALCKERKELDVLGAGAYDGDQLVALAGCSADCETMWQIGVDVLPAYRGQGLASALVNRLARQVFERGRVPFYCAAWSNIRSIKTALRSGFRPGWAEITAKSNGYIAGMAQALTREAPEPDKQDIKNEFSQEALPFIQAEKRRPQP